MTWCVCVCERVCSFDVIVSRVYADSPFLISCVSTSFPRLSDLLQNYEGIAASLSQMVLLVLDEADRLLDMGFKPDLDAIFSMLPTPDRRQTQLFSATFPANVEELTNRTLKRDHAVVNTVGDEDDQTHQHVVQATPMLILTGITETLAHSITKGFLAHMHTSVRVGKGQSHVYIRIQVAMIDISAFIVRVDLHDDGDGDGLWCLLGKLPESLGLAPYSSRSAKRHD